MLRVNTQVLLKKVLIPVNSRRTNVPVPISVKVVSINLIAVVQILSAVQHILVNRLVTAILKTTKENADSLVPA